MRLDAPWGRASARPFRHRATPGAGQAHFFPCARSWAICGRGSFSHFPERWLWRDPERGSFHRSLARSPHGPVHQQHPRSAPTHLKPNYERETDRHLPLQMRFRAYTQPDRIVQMVSTFLWPLAIQLCPYSSLNRFHTKGCLARSLEVVQRFLALPPRSSAHRVDQAFLSFQRS